MSADPDRWRNVHIQADRRRSSASDGPSVGTIELIFAAALVAGAVIAALVTQ